MDGVIKYKPKANPAHTIAELMAHSQWISLHKCLLHVMEPDMVVLYAFLLDHCKQLERHLPRTGGWFYCTVEKMRVETGFSKKQQARTLAKLMASGFIKVTKKGRPPLRHVWIDLERLQGAVEEGIAARTRLMGQEGARSNGARSGPINGARRGAISTIQT